MGIVKKAVKAVTGALGLGGSSQAKAQERALKQAQEAAEKQAYLAQQSINAANAKTPDVEGMKNDNKVGGIGSTMLTGVKGAEVADKNKNKKTLLGDE